MAVIIGVDPHKGSHTAVAIDQAEQVLGGLRVRSSADQVAQLLYWASQWPGRTWAVEGAGGLGCLLAQQLVAAGEAVVDVQPKLGARVRLLATGSSNKNDPNDARSVAIAALRSSGPRQVAAEDHAAVLKLWAKRRRDLGSLRTQAACRLHAVLCDLVPGGHPKKDMTAAQAGRALERVEPVGAVAAARYELAMEFLGDLRRIDTQMRDTKKRLEVAVKASGTTVTEVFGVGPYVAATVIGYVGDVARFLDRDRFAAYNGTAPIEVSSGNHKIFRLSRRGNRRLNHAVHMAAVTQVRFRHSEGRAYYDRKISEGKTHKEALRCLKRRISDAIFAHLVADAKRKAEAVAPQAATPEAATPEAATPEAAKAGPGGQTGNGSIASVAGSHPERRLFGEATPGPVPTIRPNTARGQKTPPRAEKKARKAS
jgi:transposase